MSSDQQYLAIEVTIATNYVISFLYNKLPRRRVDVFADELSAALHKKLAAEGQSTLSQRVVRIPISPPLDIDTVVTDAIRSSGLTVEEVVQELPLALAIYIEAGEVAYSIGNSINAEPIPIYSTRRVLSEGGSLNSGGAFLNPSVDAVGLLDGVDPNLLALLSIRPIGNNSSAAVPTAVFAQTKFGSTKFRSQNSGSARRPSRLNGGSGANGPQPQNGGSETPTNHGPRSNGSTGSTSGVRLSSAGTPNGWPPSSSSSSSSQAPPQSGIVSPTSRYQQNENIFSSPPLPPVVTSAAAAVLGNSTMSSCGSGMSANGRQTNGNFRNPSTADFAYLLQDLHGSGSSISSPALSEFAPSLTSSFDGNLLRNSNGPSMNGHHGHVSNGNSQRHSYHGNGNNGNSNIPSLSSSTSGGFFPSNTSSSNASSALGSLLFDSGIVSPTSWASSTPVSNSSAAARAAEKLAAVQQQQHNSTFSDHSNSSTSSSGSLSLFNGSMNGGHCGADSWGLGGSNGSNGSSSGTNVFGDTNASLTGTSQWVQSLRMAAGPSGWDQLTVSES